MPAPGVVHFAGVRGTSDFGVGERPESFRQMIQFLNPNGVAPLFALTDLVASEALTDPHFHWWNERNGIVRLTAGAAVADAVTTNITLTSGGLSLRPNQIIQFEKTEGTIYDNELGLLSSVTSDTAIVVKRGQFGTTATAHANGVGITGLGTAHGQNSAAPAPISRNPVKYDNYTSIFRNTFALSRTAKQTEYRTGDAYKNDRRRCTFDHSRDIEMQFLFGRPSEIGTDPLTGKPRTTTGGLRHFLQSNVTIFNTTPTQDTFLDAVYKIWDWNTGAGDQRIGFCGNGFLNSMNKLARNAPNSQINHTEVIKLYGMKLKVWQFPQGEIGFRTHPLMNQHPRYTNSAFIIDPSGLKYRHLQDTKFQENMQVPGVDGILDGFITEAGLEVLTEETMAYIGNFVV